jgi:hypothetical protein
MDFKEFKRRLAVAEKNRAPSSSWWTRRRKGKGDGC